MTGYAAKRNYASKRDNYRKLERNDVDLGVAQADSDSDFDGMKVKGSRDPNKISRVSIILKFYILSSKKQ